MLRNYLLTAWRSLLRNRVYGFINIAGLATGLAVALVIGLWAYHEYSYDKFLPDYDRIYQVRRNFDSNGEILNFTTTSLKLSDAIRQVPEIERVVVSDWMGPHGLMVGEKKLISSGAIADDGFLDMFRFPALRGNVGTAMKDPYSIVLTESLAKALFGNADPLGQMVRFENKQDLKVTAVLKDVPANSSLQFSYVIPLSYYESASHMKNARTSFANNAWQQFAQLREGVSQEQVAPKLRFITRSEQNYNAQKSEVVLQPMARWHLYSQYINGRDLGGFIDYVRMFLLIGLAVLLIACINFINLSTARSEKRAREVGVRKAVGSLRSDLLLQFLLESFCMTLIAFVLASLLVEISLPYFNRLTGRDVRIPYGDPRYWVLLLVLVLVTSLAAGARPAIFMSGFRPVQVLKGRLYKGRASALPRKVLVVVQFTCSIALIVSTAVVYRQVQHVKDRPTGFDLNSLVMTYTSGDLGKNYTALRNELLQKKLVSSITQASSPATDIYWHSGLDNWPGKYPDENIEMATVIIGEDYFKTMGISFVQGREFASLNDTTRVIFNETAMQQMRINDPVGKKITWGEEPYEIIGVVKDALIASPFSKAEPMMFLTNPGTQGALIYRLTNRLPADRMLAELTTIFNRYNPSFPYDYHFADSDYAAKFNTEIMIGRLSGIFAALAVLISCLGLFGLAAYMAEQRNKEIGIRKVLGASVLQVWMLLSKDFMLLVGISILIAAPLAWYFLSRWLNGYEYRVVLGAGVFLLAGVLAMVITLLTVSVQSVRAALANPVSSLKDE